MVKFAYAAEREDELSLVKGSRVTVMEKCSDGWWRGSYNGQVGWFPSNYVLEELDEAAGDAPGGSSLRPGATLSNGQGARALQVVQTLYPFSSVTEEELNFDKGETMEVIEKPENDPEWWRCRNARGQVGLVPKNYVVVLSEGPAPHAGSGPAGPARAGRFAGREWYYGNVTRHQAECALNARGVQGDFLVRDSESSVSARWGGGQRDVCVFVSGYAHMWASLRVHQAYRVTSSFLPKSESSVSTGLGGWRGVHVCTCVCASLYVCTRCAGRLSHQDNHW